MAQPSSHTSAQRSSVLLSSAERAAAALDAAGLAITSNDPRALLQIAVGAGDDEPVAAILDVLAAHIEVIRTRAATPAEDLVLAHLEALARVGAKLARISREG